MLNADKYTIKLQKIGFDKEQAKQVADKMISFAYLIVDNYLTNKSTIKAKNPSESIAQTEQNSPKKIAQSFP